MSSGPWSNKFVGSHFLLTEPANKPNESWDVVPDSWSETRFDAIDVLLISTFFVKADNLSFELGDGINLVQRFEWVIRAARSKNPNIIIILEQFYHGLQEDAKFDFQLFNGDSGKIKTYADSVASFIESYYNKTLPDISGTGQISARIQGYDVDVESSTYQKDLPKILTAVRERLDILGQKLGASKFSVSITPAWPGHLDSTVAQSCDYINMQNYSGGQNTFPQDYLSKAPGLRKEQFVWGFCSEVPRQNTEECKQFTGVQTKAQAVASGAFGGTYTWRVNSDNHAYENIFQVWLHNLVHGTVLPDSEDQSIVQKYWKTGGRDDNGQVIQPHDLK
ncbi:hypothetical protein FSARC_6262 [Fusarium sarcochroum]|uniref:Endo-beta-N-acetylglucosaminidase EndoS/F2-like TIM-barrel domain-containing protein n=1 Tax=Fusarium sarcochroum TaxID=1208366 RepID=A0A8H4X9I6_9HYPO|nr:hypothetical protein FSARC_6262 [Fusarium sarcochroum]